MNSNGNGTHNGARWWQAWKRKSEVDLSDYRRLALQLHHGLPRSEASCRSALIVTPNELLLGASGAVTLASCMAEELRRPVLLIDATENSEVSRILRTPGSQGLTDFLADPTRPVQELALQTSEPNLWFLPRGTGKGSSFPASPEHVHELLVRSAKQWDFIVVAGGSVLKNALALTMAPSVGRVLLLVMENRTQLDDIDAAQNALQQCQARNVSLVLTELGGVFR